MSPTQMTAPLAAYNPSSDALVRHDYGVTKYRRPSSTGGGRTWSEEEESYLVQTRLRKMPYKHIAAHLKKTELACRLHYHQLCHGSGRRRRTASCSSISSEQSPVLPSSAVDSIHGMGSRSLSPPGGSGHHPVLLGNGMQLPSIMSNEGMPRLPAILPKPPSMPLSRCSESTRALSRPIPEGYAALPSVSSQHQMPHQPHAPALRLDCSVVVAPNTHNAGHIDLNRLRAVYDAHRSTFWAVVAKDYGANACPAGLEQAWKTGMCCSQQATSPITPSASPDQASDRGYDRFKDKTRIASILGVDADPRSGREREIVRLIEEERFGTMTAMV